MRFLKLPSIFKKKKEKEEEEEEVFERPSISISENEPFILGFLSGKGGCGKSTIAANTIILLSALCKKGEGIVAVDTDITNATLTSMMFSITPDVLKEDDGVSTLDYIVEGAEEYQLYKLEFPPNKIFSIQVAGREDLGVVVKDIYVLPAKKATISYEQKLSMLAYLRSDEIKSSLQELYVNIAKFARKQNVRYVIFDFPPLRPDQRKVYEGVFALLEQIPNFILIAPFDYSAVHGLIAILNKRYSYLKARTLAFFINMAIPGEEEISEKIKRYIETIYGKNTVYFIRADPRWRVSFLPPIILGDPSEGAHYDLIKAYVSLGIIDKSIVKKKLNIEF